VVHFILEIQNFHSRNWGVNFFKRVFYSWYYYGPFEQESWKIDDL